MLRRLQPTPFRGAWNPCSLRPALAPLQLSSLAFSTTTGVLNNDAAKSSKSPWSLQGKNIVVTGGGRGIGMAMCRSIAESGARVAILDALKEPDREFEQLKNNATYIRTDVTQEQSLKDAFEQGIQSLGSIDGCITAAGICLDKPFLEHEWDESLRIQMVNVMGTFYSVKLAAEQMRKQDTGGSIVMIASVGAHVAIPGQRLAAYHASKGAVRGLLHPLAVELADHQVRINTVSPGYIRTAMTESQGAQNPGLLETFERSTPLKRMGERADLTGAAVYLLSDSSSYTTGADIMVTGGLHAGRIYGS